MLSQNPARLIEPSAKSPCSRLSARGSTAGEHAMQYYMFAHSLSLSLAHAELPGINSIKN
jgi:hypothetical protein